MSRHAANREAVPAAAPGYRMRRERLGEWAVLLVLSLAIGFWRLWPQGDYQPRSPDPLPEPDLAYVDVIFSGSRLAQKNDWLTRNSSARLLPQALSLLPPMAIPLPAAPAYSEPFAPEPTPPPMAALRLTPLPLPHCETFVQTTPLAEAWHGCQIHLSAALQRSGFNFPLPQQPGTLKPGSAFYRITLDETGRVANLLDESSHREAAVGHLWRRALLSGRGTNGNVSGSVMIEWR